MALVSGGRSTLNPDAPLFIPAAVRQVEDFSPEWWDLVTTSTWFRDYWLSQHQGENIFGEDDSGFYANNVIESLPDNIDLDVDEEILNMEAQFEEFLQSSEVEYAGVMGNGIGKNGDAFMKSLQMPMDKRHKSPREGIRHWDKPAKHVGPKYSPRFIQQPR